MLDKLSAYIQHRLIDLNLDKRVNVVHLSDHGMSSVSPPNFIDLRPVMTNGTYTTYGTSPVLQIVPKNSCKSYHKLDFVGLFDRFQRCISL